MVWRETFPPASDLALDAEAERERRLAAQARAGADWALTALIARYQPPVTRYLTRLCGDQSRARELAERVFQRMERRLHGPHGADSLRLWLLRASTEAGLETLRRPQRGQAPRLGATPVAGLLPAESGSGPQHALRGGISRLKNVVGAVSRQARPLVWQGTTVTQRASSESREERARETLELEPVDESLDTLDPREALRHRLVRLTLAELPYGDAQCLALHLVAGLNQAEVARALGITNSAARKRIVRGLSQFSARYKMAVASLGLPEELGYGAATPQPVEVAAPPIAAPEPPPVIISQTPEELDSPMGEPAPTTIPLAVDSYDDESSEPLNSVTYYESSSPGESPAYYEPVALDYFSREDEAGAGPPYAGFATEASDSSEMFAVPYTAPSAMSAMVEESEALSAAEAAEVTDKRDTLFADQGSVTRIAADAIVGPVVDALPVHSEPLALTPDFGARGPRSTPLTYELASGDEETGGITMNWVDSTGMMAPLSFETTALPMTMGSEPGGDDDPWARSTILEFEAPALEDVSSADTAGSETADFPPLDMSIALDEGNYGWERSHQDVATPDLGGELLTYESSPLEGQTPVAFYDGLSHDQDTYEQADTAARPTPPVTRTLEDLWDEAPDLFGR